MHSRKKTARLAGLLYLLMSIPSVFSYIYVPSRFIVSGDATATLHRIAEGALMYRFSILSSLVSQLLFVFVVLALYELFKDVDRRKARIMVALVCVGVAAELVAIAMRMTPFLILDRPAYLSVFTQPQLDALAYALMRLGGYLGRLVTSIWGLWLIPFGILTIKSRFLPRILGVLLLAAGVGYMATCATAIAFPDQLAAVTRVAMVLYFGELPIIFWLLVMGAKEPQEAAPAAA